MFHYIAYPSQEGGTIKDVLQPLGSGDATRSFASDSKDDQRHRELQKTSRVKTRRQFRSFR